MYVCTWKLGATEFLKNLNKCTQSKYNSDFRMKPLKKNSLCMKEIVELYFDLFYLVCMVKAQMFINTLGLVAMA